MRSCLLAAVLCGLLALIPTPSSATEGSRFHPGVTSPSGVVATESPAAAAVGRDVLEHGGDAIDAAVATAFALGGAPPPARGIGRGGGLGFRRPRWSGGAPHRPASPPAAAQDD